MQVALLNIPIPKLPLSDAEKKYAQAFFQKYARIYLNHLSPNALKNIWQIERVNQGLLYIASYLRKFDHNISYFSHASNPYSKENNETLSILEEVVNIIKDCDVICIYSITCNYHIASAVATKLKSINPKLIIGLGGPHATAIPNSGIEDIWPFDFLGIGEGERTVLEIIECLNSNGKLKPVPGTIVKIDGKLFKGPRRAREEPVIFSIPAYNLSGASQLPLARIFPNRGCPNSCVFCADPWRNKVTHVLLEKIAKEVDILYSKYNTRFLYIGCEDFLVDEARAIEVAKVIHETHSDIRWVAQCRVKKGLREKALRKLLECGCVGLEFGVESSSQFILDKARKNISLEDAQRCFEVTKKMGFRTHAYWMIGLPGESKDTAKKTIRKMIDWGERSLTDTWEYKMLIPYPGTPVYMHPEKYGIRIHTHDFSLYHYLLDPVISTAEVSQSELKDIYHNGLYLSAEVLKSDLPTRELELGVDLETIENLF